MLGKKNKPFFVAEISSNHNGKLSVAKKLISLAKAGGADAVKLQTYTAKTMTVNSKKKYFMIRKGLWKGYSLWDLYKKAKTPYNWHKKLFKHAKKIGIKIFSTPFDETAVDFLEKLNCPFYKVSSFEMNDIPLIKKIISTKKPLIISTGTSSIEEITQVLEEIGRSKFKNLSLLYCVSNYPAKINDFNLYNIKIMKKKFNCEIGFSDHSTDNVIAAAASKAGATLFEKHICLKKERGLDYDFSLNEDQIKDYRNSIDNPSLVVNNSKIFTKLLGKKTFTRKNSENISKNYRRSIFTVKKIKKGEIFTKKNIKRIRPGYGISARYFENVLGKVCKRPIDAYEPLTKKFLGKIDSI